MVKIAQGVNATFSCLWFSRRVAGRGAALSLERGTTHHLVMAGAAGPALYLPVLHSPSAPHCFTGPWQHRACEDGFSACAVFVSLFISSVELQCYIENSSHIQILQC